MGLHFFSSRLQMTEWPLHLFLHLFLLFFLSHSSHQITINASPYFDFASTKNIFLQLSLVEWPLPVSFLWSSACPTHFGSLLIKRSQTSHKSWKTGVTCSLNELLKKHVGWTHGAVHPTYTTWLMSWAGCLIFGEKM